MAEATVEYDDHVFTVGYDWEPYWPREEPSADSPGDPGQDAAYVIHVIDGADVDDGWELEDGTTFDSVLHALTLADPEGIMATGDDA